MRSGSASKQRGFTLIELLIVIAIIGVLAAIAIQAYAQYRATAYDARAMHDLANAAKAEEAYYATFESYKPVPATEGPAILDAPGLVISESVTLVVTVADGGQSFDAKAASSKGSKTFGYNSVTDTIVND